MKRRRFLQTLSLGAALGISSVSTGFGQTRPLPSIGFIAGILSNELKKDWQAALRHAAKMGYTELEIGRPLGNSAEEFLAFCGEIGLRPVASGGAMSGLLKDSEKAIDQALALKAKYLVCYWPWMTGAENLTAAECRQAAENLNALGEKASSAGLVFCFHNHDKEFRAMEDGKTAFEHLMRNTDPKTVKMELDLYWVQKGGGDCLRCLTDFPGRYEILHVKDMDKTPERSFACVGEGILDFPVLFKAAMDQGVEHYIVEKDNEQKGLECLQVSAEYLKKLRV